MDITAHTIAPDPARCLWIMAASIGGEIGVAFLEKLVATLKDAMDAELVVITIGEGTPPTRARTIFALEAGVRAENIEYDLEGTPCQQVYQGKTIIIPDDLADRFPKEEGLSGYVGVPIRNDDGHVIGHFAVFSKDPIKAPEAADAIVRIFGARVEADQRHKQLVDHRDKLIAELVQTNETLKARNQALHDANQSKTSLLGMVAHDLRNPLSAIIAQTELLQTLMNQQRMDRDKIDGRIGKIMANADRLTGLIEATLTRCRSESGEIELRRRRVNASSLVATAIETNSREALRKSISVKFEGQSICWAKLDDGLCLEAIDNLISNAIKYSQPNTEVHVGGSQREQMRDISGEGSGARFVRRRYEKGLHPISEVVRPADLWREFYRTWLGQCQGNCTGPWWECKRRERWQGARRNF